MKKFVKFMGAVVPFFAAFAIEAGVAAGIMFMSILLFSFKEGITAGINGVSDQQELTQNIMKKVTEITQSSNLLLFATIAGAIICGIVFFFWYRSLRKGLQKVKLKSVLTFQNFVLFLFLGIGCQAFLSGILGLIEPLFKSTFDNYSKIIGQLLDGNIIMVVLYTVLIAPVVEEMIFRGVILHKATKVIPFLGANILQAALFGIFHGNIVQGIYAFFLGFLFGLICEKYKTIYASILLHMIVNASAFLMMLVPENTPGRIIVVIAGGAFIILSFRVLKKARMDSYEIQASQSTIEEDQLKM